MASLNTSDNEHEKLLLAVTLTPIMLEACLGCATVGILLFMCTYGLNLYLETPKELRKGRGFYVVTSFIILILHCVGELPFTYIIFNLLYKSSNWQETYSLRDELASEWWFIASYWATRILMWVGDGLLVYRCHIVWTGRPMVTVIPATLYLAALGVSIFQLIKNLSGSGSWDANAVWIFLSVGVNGIVTFLISFRLFRMRKEQSALMAPIDSKVYISVVSILVESAFPLAVTGVIAAGSRTSIRVHGVLPKSAAVMYNIATALYGNFSALAPALIIFRVAAGRSWEHNTRNTSHLSTLAFQPHASTPSGAVREVEAAPLDDDVEKNRLDAVPVIRDRIPGSDSEFTDGSSNSPNQEKKQLLSSMYLAETGFSYTYCC